MNTKWQQDAINDLIAWEKAKRKAKEESLTVANYFNRRNFNKHNYIIHAETNIQAVEG